MGGSRNQIMHGFQKSSPVGQIIDHECCKRFCSVQRDVASLIREGTNVHATCLQPLEQLIPVRLGSDNDGRIPFLQGVTDEVGESIQ